MMRGVFALGAALYSLAACSQQEVVLGVAGPASDGLVFVREVDGRADLARARLSDGAVIAITRSPEREERWPYWSDVAGRLAYQSRLYAAPHLRTAVHLWDPRSGEETVVTPTPTPGRDERWPHWSPTQPQLVFAFKGGAGNRSGVMLHDLASGKSTLLGGSGPQDFYLRPAFAPDGSRLVIQRRTPPGAATRLWILQPNRPPQPLPHPPGAFDLKARFSRDGQRIFFTRRASQRGPGDLFWMDPASGALQALAPSDADDHSAWPSPTRDEISFISDRDGTRDVFLLGEGGEPHNLTRTPEFDEGAPIWSPDGERLVVLRVPPGVAKPDSAQLSLVVLDRQGRTLFESQGQMADWMPAWPADAGARPAP